ncbi:cytidine deaminase [Patescibacteria group bacterium]|nr:cytidine deaminase [Patescibacteria group bacterium]
MNNDELIQVADDVLHRYTDPHGRLHGDVGAAVLGKNGKVYRGVCVDTSGWGLCAERSALAAMITDQEYTFQKIVAVWRDDKTGELHVLPPCGHCRQFMRNISEENMDAEVLLGRNAFELLKDLIPYHEWPQPIE